MPPDANPAQTSQGQSLDAAANDADANAGAGNVGDPRENRVRSAMAALRSPTTDTTDGAQRTDRVSGKIFSGELSSLLLGEFIHKIITICEQKNAAMQDKVS